jgi:hypothetical protein
LLETLLKGYEAPNKTARQENLEDGGPNPQGRQRLR